MLTAVQHRTVLRHEEAGLVLRKEIVVASPDGRAAVDAQRFFLRLVPADEFQVLGILDEEHDRQVFEHRVQEAPGIFEFSRSPRQRLLGPLVLGQFLFQLSVDCSQLGREFILRDWALFGLPFLLRTGERFAGRARHQGQRSPDSRPVCPRQRLPGGLPE